VVAVVGVVGAETEVHSVEVVEAGIRVLAVVEVPVAAVVAVAVEIIEEAAEILEEATEIPEAGEVVASTVVGVEVAPESKEVSSWRTSRRLWMLVLWTSPKMSSSCG